MWTVLLVEDERFVRESIIQIIDWEQEGFTVMGEADNGLEAFQFIEQHQPDLIICDILMPVMDGIELLRKVRKNGWSNRFLMLTAHTEFEYARQAVEYGASNYILKLSMSVESLVTSLQKIKTELKQDQKHRYDAMKDLYARYWECVIDSDHKVDTVQLLTPFESVIRHSFLVMIAMFPVDSRMTSEDVCTSDLFSSSSQPVIHSFSAKGQTTFFCWFTTEPTINPHIKVLHDTTIVCSPVTDVSKLTETWQAVISALDHIWYQKDTKAYMRIETNQLSNKETISFLLRQLFHVIEQWNIDKCKKSIDTIWDHMEVNAYSMLKVKEIASWINQTLVKINNLTDGTEVAINQARSHIQLKNIIFDTVSNYIRKHHRFQFTMTDHTEVNKVIEYIASHYEKNISVKFLAKHIGMDENYLSALFKKKTGQSLIHYLHGIRIQHAEEYLRHTKLSVSKISERVGFVNDNYFIKIFKRMNQVTPSQYRRKFLSLNERRAGAHELS